MVEKFSNMSRIIFTIGHSNHSPEGFVKLLRDHGIDALVDVRSHPHSKHVPWFNKGSLKSLIRANGIKYLYLGQELGGMPGEATFYDEDGYVLYSRLAESTAFLQGISRIHSGILKYRVAIMCSEENPIGCHRRLLIARVLERQGITVQHLRGNGAIQTEAELRKEEETRTLENAQPLLFNREGADQWKSIRSVSQKSRPQHSSEN